MSGSVTIVGAGLAGSLLATMLGQRGYRVDVYERRSDPRLSGAERGRSINLAISARGLAALAEVDLRDEVLKRGIPMRGRMLHDRDGTQTYRSYSPHGDRAINSISRGELNAILLDSAERQPGVTIHFDHRLVEFDVDSRRMVYEGPHGQVAVANDAVIGTDGAYSVVRRHLQMREGFDYRQDYLTYGYRELSLPAVDGEFALDPHALHIWPRGSSMMIALPNLDRSFTCTLFWPKTGPDSFSALESDGDVDAYFAENYADARALMPDLMDDFRLNPIGSLVTVRCSPWWSGQVAVLGDAAHAIVPFYGQGANAAFEDCISLTQHLDATGGDWARALPAYGEERKPNADAIADLALHNFVEMRDSVTSHSHKALHHAEHALHRVLGETYRTRYDMVSFSTMPYADIEPRVRKQRSLAAGALAVIAAGAGFAGAGIAGKFRRPS
jgi:kynurenine 3-monooxygenase